ncbi:MAG: MerR family transcriptional regulator [Candidatus Babeliales bacterium]|nr:MerR family transcriptional regulator [Candidatus Babeliales bacterium]
MNVKKKKGYYSISAVAKMFSVHQQTIRLYEKEGLITPQRSDGNTRMFTEEDVSKLEEVIHLTHQLGINLAGVEMILKLQKQIKKMQRDMNKIFEKTQNQFTKDIENSKQIVDSKVKQLLKIKENPDLQIENNEYKPIEKYTQKNKNNSVNQKNENSKNNKIVDLGSWEIEYDN